MGKNKDQKDNKSTKRVNPSVDPLGENTYDTARDNVDVSKKRKDDKKH